MNKRILSVVIALLLLCTAALADTVSFEGTVGVKTTHEIYAPIGGTIDSVEVEAGQFVHEGDVLAKLSTNKVYADEAGTVTGVFGQAGDSAESVAGRYGAVLYIEGDSKYTIAASTENAYNSTETKFVHVGESVYLSCNSDGDHTGTGVITAIQGTDFTVEVLEGEFLVGENVNVYRGEKAVSSKRVGRGPLSRRNPVAVSGSGSIVSFAVADGDHVSKGDLLFETLNGSFDGYYMSGTDILADCDGTVAQLNLVQGGMVEKKSVCAVLYTPDAMRIEGQISEYDLADIAVGDEVEVELYWNQDEDVTYPGTVTMISRIATAAAQGMESEEAQYTVYVDFTPDENTLYGMSAVVTTVDEENDEIEDFEETEDEVEEDA